MIYIIHIYTSKKLHCASECSEFLFIYINFFFLNISRQILNLLCKIMASIRNIMIHSGYFAITLVIILKYLSVCIIFFLA